MFCFEVPGDHVRFLVVLVRSLSSLSLLPIRVKVKWKENEVKESTSWEEQLYILSISW